MGNEKTIKISAAAHRVAKQRSRKSGIKLYRFIEMAIDAFTPEITVVRSTRTPDKQNAG